MNNVSRDPEERKIIKKRRSVKFIAIIILIFTLVWSSFTVYEYSRVADGKDTILCFNETKSNENDDEYSVTCYGILYKYRKYFYIENDNLIGREFTMFFMDFKGAENNE